MFNARHHTGVVCLVARCLLLARQQMQHHADVLTLCHKPRAEAHLTLGIVEVGWHSDDCLLNLVVQELSSISCQLAQDLGTDLLRRELLVCVGRLDLDITVAVLNDLQLVVGDSQTHQKCSEIVCSVDCGIANGNWSNQQCRLKTTFQ
jgi:hypothetical protein